MCVSCSILRVLKGENSQVRAQIWGKVKKKQASFCEAEISSLPPVLLVH